jgi:hypothetical protein
VPYSSVLYTFCMLSSHAVVIVFATWYPPWRTITTILNKFYYIHTSLDRSHSISSICSSLISTVSY